MNLDELKRECPVFADKVCPFAKLPEEHKGAAGKCPAFQKGCPFKECKTVGEFEDKLGQMRDQCKGVPAYLEFLRETMMTGMVKKASVGSACPFFQTGCPFAKDTSGKPILSPDYIAVCFNFINYLNFPEIVAPLTFSHLRKDPCYLKTQDVQDRRGMHPTIIIYLVKISKEFSL